MLIRCKLFSQASLHRKRICRSLATLRHLRSASHVTLKLCVV